MDDDAPQRRGAVHWNDMGYRTTQGIFREEKTMDMRQSEKVSDGAVLPAHVQRRARDHSREPENDQSQSWDLQSTFLQLRERVPLHPAIP